MANFDWEMLKLLKNGQNRLGNLRNNKERSLKKEHKCLITPKNVKCSINMSKSDRCLQIFNDAQNSQNWSRTVRDNYERSLKRELKCLLTPKNGLGSIEYV